MFNKYLFGFIEGFGEMLFPDFSNGIGLRVATNSTHTLEQDSFVVQFPPTGDSGYVTVNGKTFSYTFGSQPLYHESPCFYAPKGTVLGSSGAYTLLLVFPVTKGGGGVAINESHFRGYNHA